MRGKTPLVEPIPANPGTPRMSKEPTLEAIPANPGTPRNAASGSTVVRVGCGQTVDVEFGKEYILQSPGYPWPYNGGDK